MAAQGDTSGALDQWAKAIAAPDRDGAHGFAHFNRGEIAKARRDWKTAASAYREAVKRQPRSVDALFGLGRAMAELRQFTGAVASFREVTRLDPTYTAAWFNMGVVLEDSGELEAAIAAHRKTLVVDSTYVRARASLDRLIGWGAR